MSTAAKVPSNHSTVRLTHYGRKTGKPYHVTIWYVVIDGKVWIGSLNRDRNWVRNVRAKGRAELDFGSGPIPAACRWAVTPAELEHFRQAVRRKHFIMSAILMSPIGRLYVRGEPAAFETDLVAAAA